MLVNPNLQVYSEELKARIADEQQFHLRMTRLKLKKAGKLDVFETSFVPVKEPKKGKDSAKKRNKLE